MSFNLMLFLIVTVALFTNMIVKVSARKKDFPHFRDDGRLNRIEESLDKMERRLANLETIVTDKDYHLKNEFENLERS